MRAKCTRICTRAHARTHVCTRMHEDTHAHARVRMRTHTSAHAHTRARFEDTLGPTHTRARQVDGAGWKRRRAGRCGLRQAVVARGRPSWPAAGRCGPGQAFMARGRPSWPGAGRCGPGQAVQGRAQGRPLGTKQRLPHRSDLAGGRSVLGSHSRYPTARPTCGRVRGCAAARSGLSVRPIVSRRARGPRSEPPPMPCARPWDSRIPCRARDRALRRGIALLWRSLPRRNPAAHLIKRAQFSPSTPYLNRSRHGTARHGTARRGAAVTCWSTTRRRCRIPPAGCAAPTSHSLPQPRPWAPFTPRRAPRSSGRARARMGSATYVRSSGRVSTVRCLGWLTRVHPLCEMRRRVRACLRACVRARVPWSARGITRSTHAHPFAAAYVLHVACRTPRARCMPHAGAYVCASAAADRPAKHAQR
jgi:hypothetical protein